MKSGDFEAMQMMTEMEQLVAPLKTRFDLNSLSPTAYRRVHELVYMWATSPGFGVDRAKQMSKFFPAFQPMVWLCTVPEFLVAPEGVEP